MASSLAAAIKDRFGITANLREGHGGIFEVTIDRQVIYTNSNVCGQLPEMEEILGEIREYGGRTVPPSPHAEGEEHRAPGQAASPERAAGGTPDGGMRC
ncbi:MAG: Rdx family protein [Dehalococcoidia bacterium]|nr:Rdx family protein [Dehalococcoidia bacterium]